MPRQLTDQILMIKPREFYKNPETAVNNYFQADGIEGRLATDACHLEFSGFVDKLKAQDLNVHVFEQSDPEAVDAIFPNNWFSTHEDGTLILYPMFAKNRRIERRAEFIEKLKTICSVKRTIDLTYFEERARFLEGTGSLILDRVNKIAYCAISERSHPEVLQAFCEAMGYQSVLFSAYSMVMSEKKPIYHTNVLMSVGSKQATLCLDCIFDESERKKLILSLEKSGKEIIEISSEQMMHFAGNVLQLESRKGEKLLIMSTKARSALTQNQIKAYQKESRLIDAPLDTIETLGGGSARCMIAELFVCRS